MKRIKQIILLWIVSVSVVSCGYLDIVPDSIATIEDNAFSMRSEAEKYLFTCYSYMPADGSLSGNPALLGGDEIYVSENFRSQNSLNAVQIFRGNQKVSSPYLNFWDGVNSAKNLYRGISDCNIFLENISKVPDMNNAEKNRWIAEVEFLKAYYHFYLIRMYGPIPIKDKNLKVNAATEELRVYRNTLDECFDYVANKLDDIYSWEYLPPVITSTADELGRITQGIVLTLKAKVLLTAASPLFNGNTDYIGLKDAQGIEIFNPVKTDEQRKEKWDKAAKACKEAIDFLDSQGINELYRFTSMELNISSVTRVKMNIRMSFTDKWNKEMIWANSNSWVTSGNASYQQQAMARDLEATKTTNTDQRNNEAVPLKIAMLFYTKNGVSITEDKTWNYNERFSVKEIGENQKYLLAVGQMTAGLNFDREPRYYADLGFDRGVWYGQGVGIASETDQYLKGRRGESASDQAFHSTNLTGIWPKKLVHYKSTINGSSTGSTMVTYPFPIFRLADLYLMYAEAINEAADDQTNRDESIKYLDIIRDRAGLKGVIESWTNYSTTPSKYTTQRGLREIIQQERTIELIFEGHRFWDLRRWKTAMTELAKPITGWNLLYTDPAEYYTEKYLYTQKFTPRDYFWPINDNEILKNSNTIQNYGW
jgi:hypothetical protein